MSDPPAALVVSPKPVTLVGGGPVSASDMIDALALAPRLVAADSGADRLLALGHKPEAVIGDMDSLGAATRATLDTATLHMIGEQDTTDFEKCLTRIESPLVLGVGLSGGRLDHTLAVLNTLARLPARRCVLIGAQDVVTICPPDLDLPLVAGTRVSLFPLSEVAAHSEGLKWPLDGLALAADGPIATSNEATGPLRLSVDVPGLVLILPRGALGTLVDALATAPRW